MWTNDEILQLLTEQMPDCEEFGGFTSTYEPIYLQEQLAEKFGDRVYTYRLIGYTSWFSYEESCRSYLLQNEKGIFLFRSGTTVYGDFGEDFSEIEPTHIVEWLEIVRNSINNQLI